MIRFSISWTVRGVASKRDEAAGVRDTVLFSISLRKEPVDVLLLKLPEISRFSPLPSNSAVFWMKDMTERIENGGPLDGLTGS